MNQASKKVIFAVSAALNVLFIFLLLSAFFKAAGAQTINFFIMGAKSSRYLHTALILSVPSEGAEVNFGPVEFMLKKGSAAHLQFSMIRDNPLDKWARQSNLALEPLYDPSVVSVDPSGYGLLITGREIGETSIQIFSKGAFRDIAHIAVYGPSMLND